ncbi:MAG: bifunctional phosphoribosylaminoimidazolecarboxamide formyltransferase/IMP cyclohydrolase [Proteobacteria bacterium]|nr:bifunctional phosphoribosylaminoimidazolecarboxamide formyltransferase/IMP cyclohydrolase [Pseudomonadota bacterium]
MNKISRALVSVSDKRGVVDFAKALHERGVEILSTGGTAKALRDAGVPVVDVADYTGSPEILDGRLKTLHPKVHGGILGMRSNPKHREEMRENGIGPIDLVAVNLYPFEATIAKPGCRFEDAIENIDIGGPTMLRSAAKNHEDVAVVADSADYSGIIEEMDRNAGALTRETKFRLAKKVFAATARYDSAIISYLSSMDDGGRKLEMPTSAGFTFELVQNLRYGENPHQRAAFYRDPAGASEPAIVNARQLQGKELSYNNIMDADAVLEMVKEFQGSRFAAVIVKHANPCGAAVSDKSLAEAYENAFGCDPLSAFGGIIGVNRPLDAATAAKIGETFFEVIAAPSFEKGALEILSKKKNLRLLELPGLGDAFTPSGWNMRRVTGGLLLQERDLSREPVREARVVTKRRPSDAEWQDMEFAWRIAKHVKSNAIVYAKGGRTVGIGAGQMSRVDSAKVAVMKAADAKIDLKGSVIASDAFFPFRDGVDAAARAGASAVVQPGGSMRDEEVIAAADEHGMAMVFTGVRHFRH